MRLLLDTHAFLWLLADDGRLGPQTKALVRDRSNPALLSAVSIWESVIKHSLGKLTLPSPASIYLPKMRVALGIDSLPIVEDDFISLAAVPNHHRDPFDRL